MNSRLLSRVVPRRVLANVFLQYFGRRKVAMMGYVNPVVVALTDERSVVKIALNRRTRNHLHSMYFGALSVGADTAAGLIAMMLIRESGADISLIFKNFNAQFLRRAEGDVYFECTQGREIAALVESAQTSGERVEMAVHITATVPTISEEEPVARFILTLSLRRRDQ